MQDNGIVNFVRFTLNGNTIAAKGRDAWALTELLKAGAGGCTPITHPGPRWSGYVLKLRKRGVNIETVTEKHGGAFAGTHAKYVLRSAIEIVEVRTAPEVAKVAA